MAALDDEEIAALDLRHDARKDAVDQGVERRIPNEIVTDVDKKALVGGDGRRESVEDVGKGR